MWPSYSPACRTAVNDLLRAGGSLSAYRANKDYGAEPKLNSWACRLERQLEMRMGVKHAVAVNSGTAALHAGLAALDLRGGEVVTSPYTFSATASAILLAGGTPVFADVDPQSFCIGKEEVKRVVTRKTRAILPVSLFGHRVERETFDSFGLPVIEDACQSVGAVRSGRNDGGDAGTRCFSFNGGKNIPAGECGALLTSNGRTAKTARLLMNHAENFGTDYVSYNYRPNEVTACIAYHGLMELGENNRQRIQLADALTSMIRAERKLSRFIEVPESVKFDGSHVFYVYPFKLRNMSRHAFAKRMMTCHSIHVGEGYINPTLNHYPAFRKYSNRPLPVVEDLSKNTLCLFSHVVPGNTVKEMERTVAAMVRCVGR